MFSGASVLFSLVGWSVVPDLATKQLLSLLARYRIPFLGRPAPPGTLEYRKHHAYAFAFVVLSYLLYTLVQSARAMSPNFYQVLNVAPSADENTLKLAFRHFAKRFHPDRPEVGEGGVELFMHVRDAFEALKDPVVRFAYDRFGPDVLLWTHCKTTREFLHQGLLQSSGYHIVAAVVLLFWSAISQPTPVSFWRYVLFAALFAAELALILSPSLSPSSFNSLTTSNQTITSPTILHILFPQRTTYQHIQFLHQLFMFLSVALSRVAPHFFPISTEDPRVEAILLEKSMGLAAVADREASLMLHTELHSINASPSEHPHKPTLARMYPMSPALCAELMQKLAREIEDLVVEANIKKDVGPLRSAWEGAVKDGMRGFKRGGGQGAAIGNMNFWEKVGGDDNDDREDSELDIGVKSISKTILEASPQSHSSPLGPGDLPSPSPSPPRDID